ncbi:exported hypothetical protein [Mesorhizobium plurifarium]|uniref:Uncharacterized protein n=1 Tax=Mesorhizobium plurifarium TaxID=69974 RepID=A0A090F4E7_MESPL|nr:exported hypothetical protein [Mesorhizobium plurifarium]
MLIEMVAMASSLVVLAVVGLDARDSQSSRASINRETSCILFRAVAIVDNQSVVLGIGGPAGHSARTCGAVSSRCTAP